MEEEKRLYWSISVATSGRFFALVCLWWRFAWASSCHETIIHSAEIKSLNKLIEKNLNWYCGIYILYASVLMYSSTWLMPSRYCSEIGWTHSFSSIFITDLVLCKSRKPESWIECHCVGVWREKSLPNILTNFRWQHSQSIVLNVKLS